MLDRAARTVLRRVSNYQPSPFLRRITYVAPKTPGGPAIGQPNMIPQFSRAGWPANLNQEFLLLDNANRPKAEVVDQEGPKASQSIQTPRLGYFNAEAQAALSTVYRALNRDDLGEMVRGFLELQKLDALEKFMDADVVRASSLLAGYLSRAPKDTQRTEAETMANYFSVRGYVEPLNSAMTYHLLRDDADSILALWAQHQRWKMRVGRTAGSKVGQDERLLYVTVAAAMKDDYTIAAAAFRTSGSSFPPWQIQTFITRFLAPSTPRVRQLFRDFLHDASLARDVEHFGPLAAQVTEIGHLADGPALSDLYASIKDCLSRGVFTISATGPPNPHVLVIEPRLWSLFIWGAVQCRQVGLAEKIMKDMQGYGITPSLDMWSILLKGYSKKGMVDEMMRVIQKMRSHGLEPDLKCLIIVMGAMFDKQMLEPAREIFGTIRTYSPRPEDPDIENQTPQLLVAYNVAINGLLRSRMVTAAQSLIKEMEETGPHPDIVTYNTLLNRFVQMKNSAQTAAVLRMIADRGLEPDIYTFTILYVGASRKGDEEMKKSLIQRMKALDVKPNNALLSAAIASILSSGSDDAIPNAMDILRKMEEERDKDIQPNEVTYHTIMHSIDELVIQKSLNASDGFSLVNQIYQRMVSRGFRSNRVIHHLMLRMNLRRTDPNSLRIALSIFDQLMKEELINSDSWYILLNGLEARQEYTVAKHMLGVLRASPLDVRGSLLTVVERMNRY